MAYYSSMTKQLFVDCSRLHIIAIQSQFKKIGAGLKKISCHHGSNSDEVKLKVAKGA